MCYFTLCIFFLVISISPWFRHNPTKYWNLYEWNYPNPSLAGSCCIGCAKDDAQMWVVLNNDTRRREVFANREKDSSVAPCGILQLEPFPFLVVIKTNHKIIESIHGPEWNMLKYVFFSPIMGQITRAGVNSGIGIGIDTNSNSNSRNWNWKGIE